MLVWWKRCFSLAMMQGGLLQRGAGNQWHTAVDISAYLLMNFTKHEAMIYSVIWVWPLYSYGGNRNMYNNRISKQVCSLWKSTQSVLNHLGLSNETLWEVLLKLQFVLLLCDVSVKLPWMTDVWSSRLPLWYWTASTVKSLPTTCKRDGK